MAKEKPAPAQGAENNPQVALRVDAFSGGEMPQLDAREIPDEALAEAVNCCYRKGRFFLGRPGLVAVSASGLTGNVLHLAWAHSSLYALTTTMVRNVTGGTTVLSGTFTSGWLLPFGKWLIICTGTVVYAYAPAEGLFLCGSLYEGESTAGDVDATMYTLSNGQAAGVKLVSNTSAKRRVQYVHVWLARASGTPTGNVRVSVYNNTTKIASSTTVIEAAALDEVPARYMFTFSSAVDVPAGSSTYYVAVESTSSVNVYLYVGGGKLEGEGTPAKLSGGSWTQGTGVLAMSINGWHRPMQCGYGVVAQGRLFLADGSTVLYSAPGNPLDYYYAGGYFTFGDDEGSSINGLYYDDFHLYVTGRARNAYCTISYYVPGNMSDIKEKSSYGVGAVCKGGIFGFNDIIYVVGAWIAAIVPQDVSDKEALLDVSHMALKDIGVSAKVALDHDRAWLCVLPQDGSVVHVMALSGTMRPDVAGGPWARFSLPVSATCIHVVNGKLYVGGSGSLYYLDDGAVVDSGNSPIVCYFTTKRFDFGQPLFLKTVKAMMVEMDAAAPARLQVLYVGDDATVRVNTLFADDLVSQRTRLRTRRLQIRIGTPPDPTPVGMLWIGSLTLWAVISGLEPVQL